MERFNFQVIEKKWQDKFNSFKLYREKEKSKKSRQNQVEIQVHLQSRAQSLHNMHFCLPITVRAELQSAGAGEQIG